MNIYTDDRSLRAPDDSKPDYKSSAGDPVWSGIASRNNSSAIVFVYDPTFQENVPAGEEPKLYLFFEALAEAAIKRVTLQVLRCRRT